MAIVILGEDGCAPDGDGSPKPLAFDMPARQSFLVQMVEDRADLANAIAISSSMNNGARLAGPALAGLVIAAFCGAQS